MQKPHPLMMNNITRRDLDSVIAFLKDGDPILTQSSQVKALEDEWSEWLGVDYSVFVNSGSSANLVTMGILRDLFPEGGEVIVPALTWVSDIVAVTQNGFVPVFVDVEPRTLSMNSDQVVNNLNEKTRAVFLTHAQGFNGLTDSLLSVLEQKGIALVEDVCESHGAKHNEVKLGSIGWASNFSFYYAHHMSTIEGGMICTNDPDVYQKARMMRSHGMVREASDASYRAKYENANPDLHPNFIFAVPGYNVRNNEIGAVIGRSQLRRLDENIKKRNHNHEIFLDNLDPAIFWTNFHLTGSSNYAFQVVLSEPDERLCLDLMERMSDAKIEFRRGSAGGGNQLRQPYLQGRYPEKYHLNFPVVEHIHFYGFYIGNYPDLESDQILKLCDVLNEIGQ
jgi:CDP-4-dehydro-6-deoxyglucose reductase, E1